MKKENLSIYDIINNAKDELERAREIIIMNDDTKAYAEDSMLLSDIESSLDRMEELENRIEFALIVAVYTGCENAGLDFEYDCDNSEWREKYIKAASQVELKYEDDCVSSEWAYNTASDIAKKLISDGD